MDWIFDERRIISLFYLQLNLVDIQLTIETQMKLICKEKQQIWWVKSGGHHFNWIDILNEEKNDIFHTSRKFRKVAHSVKKAHSVCAAMASITAQIYPLRNKEKNIWEQKLVFIAVKKHINKINGL